MLVNWHSYYWLTTCSTHVNSSSRLNVAVSLLIIVAEVGYKKYSMLLVERFMYE